MSDLVTIDVQNHVADVRLNRPDKMNALSPDLWLAIHEAGNELAERNDVFAVVLSGNGRGFSAGLDMEMMKGTASGASTGLGDTKERTDESPQNFWQHAALLWRELPMPVIGAIHGVCYGAGAQIALGPDIRFAAPDIRMSIMEIKWGLIPDGGITKLTQGMLPIETLKELTWTGRVLDGAAAKELGLVQHIADDPLAAALELASEIASKNPDAIRATKRLYTTAQTADARASLELETSLQRDLAGSPNQTEAVKANFEKRAPVFRAPEEAPE